MSSSDKFKEFTLNGDSHTRRKQYRDICRRYPDADRIRRMSNHVTTKILDGMRCTVEDANRPQTRVIVIFKGGMHAKSV
jgi:hypothetical protein